VRLLATLLTLLACLAAPAVAAAHLGASDHSDTPGELEVDVAAVVDAGTPRTRAAGPAYLPTTWCGERRTTDDVAHAAYPVSLPQFRVVYAHAADRPDRFAAWADVLQANASLVARFLGAQSGGRRAPRFDLGTSCGSGYLDVEVVSLPSPRSAYVGDHDRLVADVRAQVPAADGPRNLVIFADGLSSSVYGLGGMYDDSSAGPGNVHDRGGLFSIVYAPDGTAPPAAPADGWWPEGFLHEMSHNMGAVQASAPHATANGHCYDGRDLMCYRDGPLPHPYSTSYCSAVGGAMPQVYDCGRDDYFSPAPAAGTWLASHRNVFHSVFLGDCSTLGLACGAAAAAPAVLTAPAVTGTAVAGSVLTGSPGAWSGSPSLALQWERRRDGGGWTEVPGATDSTFAPGADDVGFELRLRVVALNTSGSTVAASAAVGPVGAAPLPAAPRAVSPPVVAGPPVVGAVVRAAGDRWEGMTSRSVAWERWDADRWVVVGSGDAYVVGPADAGRRLRVRVRAVGPGGETVVASEPVVVPLPVGPAPVPPPDAGDDAPPPPAAPARLVLRRGGRAIASLPVRLAPSSRAALVGSVAASLRRGRWVLRVCSRGRCTARAVRSRGRGVWLPALRVRTHPRATLTARLSGPGGTATGRLVLPAR